MFHYLSDSMVSDKKQSWINYCFSAYVIFLLVLSVFALSAFSSVRCLSTGFFMFILLDVSLACFACEIPPFTKFGKFSL